MLQNALRWQSVAQSLISQGMSGTNFSLEPSRKYFGIVAVANECCMQSKQQFSLVSVELVVARAILEVTFYHVVDDCRCLRKMLL